MIVSPPDRYQTSAVEWLQRIFWLVFFLFPCCLALRYQSLLSGQRINAMLFVGVLIFFGALYALINLKTLDTGKPWRRELFALALIVGIAAFLRIQAVNLLDTKPISDFAYMNNLAQAWAQGPKPDFYTAIFPYDAIYTSVLAWLYALLGAGIKVAKYLNIACAILTVMLLYFLGKKIAAGKWQVGMAAGLIFACWPSMLAYSGVLSSENIFVFFLALVLWIYNLVRDHWRRLKFWQVVACYGFLGVLLGVMDFFKSIAIVIFIALLITELVSRHQGILYNRKTWLKVIAGMVACFLLYSACKAGLYAFADYQTQYTTNRSGYAYTLYIGMNFENDGVWSAPRVGAFSQLLSDNHNDFRKVSRLILQQTFSEITAKPSRLIPLWAAKFKRVWRSDDDLLGFATAAKLHPQVDYLGNEFFSYIVPALDYFFTLIILISALGSLYTIFRKPDPVLMLSALIVFGVAFLLLFTEAQQRYRSTLTPALALTAAWGLESISMFFHSFQMFGAKKSEPRR
jgi:4-amino-4-deoxy-L-arabinose transferase-like glycosyltransferase